MSTRQMPSLLGEANFDICAQYFTARDVSFCQSMSLWQQFCVAAPWPAAGLAAFVGTPIMHAPLKHVAAVQDVQWHARVDRLTREPGGWQLHGEGIGPELLDAMLIAVPAAQIVPLLPPFARDIAAATARNAQDGQLTGVAQARCNFWRTACALQVAPDSPDTKLVTPHAAH